MAKQYDWRWITSKYDGRCKRCGDWYAKGARILWKQGWGALCGGCAAKDRARRN